MVRQYLIMIVVANALLLPSGIVTTGAPEDEAPSPGRTLRVAESHTLLDGVFELSGVSSVGLRIQDGEATFTGPPPVDLQMAPEDVQDAIQRVPEWLREDTFRSLYQMLSIKSFPTPLSVETQDINGDGRPDLLVGGGDGYRVFINMGGTSPPYFAEGDRPIPPGTPPGGWFDPYITDLDFDGDPDLIAGVEGGVYLVMNYSEIHPGLYSYLYYPIRTATQLPFRRLSISHLGSENVSLLGGMSHLFVAGERTGNLYLLAIRVEDSSGTVEFNYTTRLLGRFGTNMTSPTVTSFGGDGIPDLIVGDGAGNVRFYQGDTFGSLLTIQFTRVEGLEPTFQAGYKPPGPITPLHVDLSGDLVGDLLLACGDGKLRYYYHTYFSREGESFWDTAEAPLDPTVQNYRHPSRVLGVLPRYCGNVDAYAYLRAILEAPTNTVDEISFTIAHTPEENLLYDPQNISRLITENAQLIYQIADELQYVKLKELSTPSGHMTTTSYRVRWRGEISWMDAPPDVYYWYVVHPRVTEEMALWIDPDTGGYSPPDEKGRFWREYLYYHADESYPPDPSPDHCYPKEFPPPLLRDVLSGIKIAWDGIPYTAPAGIDNFGRNNSRPFGYRDHAIEAISNWVEKSLPLNQQESGDDERPIQPVRIYHTHNGNCGELQDLTVAAARAALIPARGVCLTGEDHVWSEFYMGGWHQWDNYWSDGGSVVDHFMNYWWEWGRRGGSGVYAWRGDDAVEDVTLHYLPENQSATLNVYVRGGSSTVEGARVVVLSDWIATHEVGSPVSVPTPSIWNYTDWEGKATFHLAANKFSVRVVSTLGTYTSPLFELQPGEVRNLYVMLFRSGLGASIPTVREMNLSVARSGGERYLLRIEPAGGYTPQKNFLTGFWTPQPLPTPPVIIRMATPPEDTTPGGLNNSKGWLWHQIGPRVVMPFTLPDEGLSIRIYPVQNNIPWNVYRYRITLTKLSEDTYMGALTEGGRTHILFAAPRNFTTPLRNLSLWTREGWCAPEYFSPSPEDLNEDQFNYGGVSYINYMRWLGISIVNESALYPLGLEKGTDYLRAQGSAGGVGNFSAGTYIYWPGYTPPHITLLSPPPHTHLPCGSELSATFRVDGYLYGTEEMGYIGFDEVEALVEGENRSITADTSSKRGSLWVKYTLHSMEVFGSLMVRYILDAVPPQVSLEAPLQEVERGEPVEITITAQDDVELRSARLSYPGGEMTLNLSGRSSVKRVNLSTERWPLGEVNISVEVTDNAGLTSTNTTVITVVPPPDTTPPVVEITSPDEGESFEVGDEIVMRGRVVDDTGISRLYLSGDFGEMDLTPYLNGDSFEVILSTEGHSPGEVTLRVVAEDFSGNRGEGRVSVFLLTAGEREHNPPQITIVYPENTTVYYPASVVIGGRVTDDTGITSVEVSIDMGFSWREIEWEGEFFTFNFNTTYPVESGVLDPYVDYDELQRYPVYIRATDVWGNREETAVTLSITDVDPPVINMSVERTEVGVRVHLLFHDNLAVIRGEVIFQKGDAEEHYRITTYSLRRGEAEVEIPLSQEEGGEVVAHVEDPAGHKTFVRSNVEPYRVGQVKKGGEENIPYTLITASLVTVSLGILLLLWLFLRREYHKVY